MILQQRKKLILALLPAAMLLGACQVDSTLSVSEDETLSMTMVMSDDEGLSNPGVTCADLEANLGGEFPYATEFSIEDLGSDPLSCRFNATFDDTFYDMAVTKSGDTFTVNIPEEFWTSFNESAQLEQFGTINSAFTIQMPGDITEASAGGEINGRSVTWLGYDTLSAGISATGGAGTSSAPVETTAPAQATTAPATSDEDADSGIPAWVWIIVAVAVVAIAVVIILLRRGGNKGNTAPNVPGGFTPGGFTPGGFTPDGRTPYGAPANPAQGGVPYAQPNQFQQPGQPPQQFGQQPGEPTQG